jgi:hypothetical protein
LILKYGRVDMNNGTLVNLTAWGEGRTGRGGKGAVPEEWDRPYLKHFRATYYFAGDGMLPAA